MCLSRNRERKGGEKTNWISEGSPKAQTEHVLGLWGAYLSTWGPKDTSSSNHIAVCRLVQPVGPDCDPQSLFTCLLEVRAPLASIWRHHLSFSWVLTVYTHHCLPSLSGLPSHLCLWSPVVIHILPSMLLWWQMTLSQDVSSVSPLSSLVGWSSAHCMVSSQPRQPGSLRPIA